MDRYVKGFGVVCYCLFDLFYVEDIEVVIRNMFFKQIGW